MDNTLDNGAEKKPKRPRIGSTPLAAGESTDGERARFERVSRPYQQRPYQPRPYQQRQQGGYQPRTYSEYNPEGHSAETTDSTTGASTEATATNNYQPRQGGYQQRPYQQRQGGYQSRQGGYQQRPYQQRQGGYQPRQGGYHRNQDQEGGYQQRPYQQRQGGYQQHRQDGQEGGYQQRPYQQRQGGYQQRQGGGYQQRQQGGYRQNQGGYQQRPGGFRQNNNNRRFQQNGDMPARGKSFTPRPKRIEYEMPIPDPNEQIRLNKFMSNAGICSRREADEFIQQGLVKVNGQVVTELGTKITHSDVVEYDDKVVALESKCYILLNKPKDCVTTSEDPQDRTTVMDLVKGACTERIYPVGRLDRNTTGVLLLTNDGDLASKLTHPKYVKKKIYHVWTDKDISEEDMQRIADGIELEDGPIHADAISYATETDRNQAGIEIHSGRNRIVRRIFESLGYHVTKLDRVYFAGLTKKNLPRGRWRYLTQEEVNLLKMGAFE